MKKLICDTNVFYDLGSGRLQLADLVGQDESLHYSPLTALELAGKWSNESHERRRDAAKAILDSGAVELADPESFLTRTFGYDLAEDPVSIHQGVIAMAESSNMAELEAGVADYKARLVRRVSVNAAERWRASIEDKWVDDILQIMRDNIPKFDAWYDPDPALRGSNQVPKLRGKDKKAFIESTKSNDWFLSLLLACQDRAFFKAVKDASMLPNKESVPKLLAAIDHVTCYAGVYTRYLIRILTEGALPERNDSGDLELFIYAVDDEHVVVTGEKKWVRMCSDAGFPDRVRHTAPLVKP